MLSRLKLFVGSSDVQVPLETIFDAMPGDIFALRNAGNTCTHATWPEGPAHEGPLVGNLSTVRRYIHIRDAQSWDICIYIIYIYNIHPIYKIPPRLTKMGLLSLPSLHTRAMLLGKFLRSIWGRRQHDGQRWVLSLVTRKDLCFQMGLTGESFCLDFLLDAWELEAKKVEQPFTVYILLDGREVLFDDHLKDTETGFLEMVALFVFCALSWSCVACTGTFASVSRLPCDIRTLTETHIFGQE